MQLVTNLNDGGAGSLRQAISAASSGEEIQFSVTGLITITSAELFINKNLIITGPGSPLLEIAGGSAFRVFNVDTGVVSISGLKVTNGSGVLGAGIHNEATLTLSDVTVADCFSGNDGGGIWNSSSITMTNCSVASCEASSGNGGGIYNSGTIISNNLNVTTCICGTDGAGIWNNGSFTQNGSQVINSSSSNNGAGVANSGTYTITDLTISGNSAGGVGDGIYNNFGTVYITRCTLSGNNFTGVYNDQGTVNVDNSTISSNGATGIYNAVGSVDIQHSTIVLNVFGLINDPGSEAAFYNTILAGNSNTDYDGDTADATSNGHNIFGVNTNPITPAAGDITVLTFAALVMGPLQNNLGPTETHALLAGSPAIDAGENSGAPPTDQRGQPRINGTFIDIGAYESLPSGDCLVFTGELPSWITLDGNCLTGAAGIFTAATKAEANALAQAALDAFVAAQEAAEFLSCGTSPTCPPPNLETLTVEGELTSGSTVSTIRTSGGNHYCYNASFSVVAGQPISCWQASADFDCYCYLLDPSLAVVDENDISGYNRPGDFGDNAAIAHTALVSGTYTFQVTTYDPLTTGSFKLVVTNGAEPVIPGFSSEFVAIYVPSTKRMFTLRGFNPHGTEFDASVTVVNTLDNSIVGTTTLITRTDSTITPAEPIIFYNPNDDSVWCATTNPSDFNTGFYFRLDPTSGAILEQISISDRAVYFGAYSPVTNKVYGCGGDNTVTTNFFTVFNCATRLYETPVSLGVTTPTPIMKYIDEIDRVIVFDGTNSSYWLFNANTSALTLFAKDISRVGFFKDGFYYTKRENTPEFVKIDLLTGTEALVVSTGFYDEDDVLAMAYNECRQCMMILFFQSAVYNAVSLDLNFANATEATRIVRIVGGLYWPIAIWNPDAARMYFWQADGFTSVSIYVVA